MQTVPSPLSRFAVLCAHSPLCRRVGVHLKHHSAFTRLQLGILMQGSYKALDVRMAQLDRAANIRDLLTPCMFAITHVTKPQAFRVVEDPADGTVKMQVQDRSYEDTWGTIFRS